MRRTGIILTALAAGLVLGAVLMGAVRVSSWFGGGPDPQTVATASLQSMREQARLTPFSARFVAVVTSSQQRFGLTARKTMILPGTVRYELDLSRIQQRDLRWDPGSKTLSISLPPLEISRPEINLGEVREYADGGVLMAISDAENRLDAANRERAQRELIRQARDALPMRLAREAAVRVVERSFAMPLRAAGIDGQVAVRFADERGAQPSYLDRSRRIEDVLKERQAQR